MEIPFHKPHITDEEINSVSEILRSGWLTMGHKTIEFEKEFAGFVNSTHAVSFNSCTAALHCALIALGVRHGDEVIIPTMTFASTAEAVCYVGAKPVLVDIEPGSHCIDPTLIEAKITSKTKAIIPVHFAGQSCALDPIMELAEKYNLYVVEDAAHALPASYDGRMIGSIGHITCFSFYATKTITTGEGGMAVTHNKEWAEHMSRLRLHGISRDAWKRYSSEGSWQYDIVDLGYKYNMTDLQAAIGLVQLRKANELRKKREKIAQEYTKKIVTEGLIEPLEIYKDRDSAWHLYPIKLNIEELSITRDGFVQNLRERGIHASVHFIPLYRFSYYGELGFDVADYPETEWVFDRTLSLPLYPDMTELEVEYVCENVLDLLNKNAKKRY